MTKAQDRKRRLFTRRRFLVAGGGIVTAGGLGFGGYLTYGHLQRFGRTALDVIPDHRVDLPAAIPRIVVARGADPAVNPYGAVAAGFDPVALDAWATSIFGTTPDAFPEYLRIAERMGLGSADYRSLQPVEVTGA